MKLILIISREKKINLKKFYKISKNTIVAKNFVARIFLNYLILCFMKNFLKTRSKIFVFLIII